MRQQAKHLLGQLFWRQLPRFNVMYCCSTAEIPREANAESRECHPDYLGSVEAVTDINGEVYQPVRRSISGGGFFHNTIWGEPLQDQRAVLYNSFTSPYRFNGKERDWETGNYYYGARYYDPKISVWLSVDPWANKYPSLSPNTFVANNPIILIDPDGRHIDLALLDENNPNYSQEAAQAFIVFAQSEEGQAFLKDYASEGQEIAGITYSQGKYDKEGLNLTYDIKPMNNRDGTPSNINGRTDVDLTQNKDGSFSGTIYINLNSNGLDARRFNEGKYSNDDFAYELIGTIVHESFIHGEYFAGDFLDGGGFDRSNVPGTTTYKSAQHIAAHRAAVKGQGRFANQGYSLMKKMNSKYNRFNSSKNVWTDMWNFVY